MAVWQAFGVAFGLTLVVLGYLYVIYRSHTENPDVPQPTWWQLVRGSVTLVFVALLLYAGTLVGINGGPNYFISAGVAIFCYVAALDFARRAQSKPSILLVRWYANVAAGSLFGIGSAVEGGPVGLLGVILSLLFTAFWLWVVVKIPWPAR